MALETESQPRVTLVTITNCSSQGNTVHVPSMLADELDIQKKDTVLMSMGQASIRVAIETDESKGEKLALPPAVQARFGLLPGQAVHARVSQGGVRLGPLVGILAPRRTGHTKPYQQQTSLFKRIFLAGRTMGIALYVFDFHDINWTTRRVRGYYYHNDRWIGRSFPLPDVIFDRATGSFPGGSSAADVARYRLVRKFGIKLFNTRLGNKMQLHRVMHANPVLRAHLPETRRVVSNQVVVGLMQRHRGVYLKQQNGAMGKGIIRLRRAAKGIHYTLTTETYQRIQGVAATTNGALSILRGKVHLGRYLAQPEIDLIRFNGRICDVRALVQRDETGTWRVTGVGVRAGKTGSVVSNLHGGGRALQLEQVLRQTLSSDDADISHIKGEVESLAIEVAETLSRSTRCLGELGVDLGIDTKGRVWIIEANSRTGRATFRRAGLPTAAALADRRPLLYAQYLAGFST